VVVNEEDDDDDDGSWEKEIEDMLDAEESWYILYLLQYDEVSWGRLYKGWIALSIGFSDFFFNHVKML
jgi:hypothetical protein